MTQNGTRFYPIGTRVKYVGGDRFCGNVSWPDGDKLEVGDVGAVAEYDNGETHPYAVHFSGAFVRLGHEDIMPMVTGSSTTPSASEQVSTALTDARHHLDTIHAAINKASSPTAPRSPVRPNPYEEELKRQRQQHARSVEEYDRKIVQMEKELLETTEKLATEIRKTEELNELLLTVKEEATRDRDHAAQRSNQVLELEREISRYQQEVFNLQQDTADARQRATDEATARMEAERILSEQVAKLKEELAGYAMATPPPGLQNLRVGMVVEIAEGQCTLLEPYTGADQAFLTRHSWWVRLPNGDERLRSPAEMSPVSNSRTSPPPPELNRGGVGPKALALAPTSISMPTPTSTPTHAPPLHVSTPSPWEPPMPVPYPVHRPLQQHYHVPSAVSYSIPRRQQQGGVAK
eukprot:TRINITY_DN37079_c0_g1_i1.p1 TRINITY_DN37079_c0_g1~~TRINITY_DN37079_c0_g1_i1.p1  ORF type:complete len:406 (+),score=56.22 TRINITY_DN37079_c0_g1_i1:34-1251(+)